MKASHLLVAVSLMALAAPVLAQQPAATPAAEPAPETIDIIVTAQRRAERLQDVPISMSVQSAEQLAKVGIVDSRGLEQVTPGLTMQQQSGYLNPSLRGVSTGVIVAGGENPIAIYVDGVYVSSLAGSVINLPDIERVEVLKGPQGTLFGRNATGGAIQVFSKAPSFTPTGKISAIAGFYDGAGSSRSGYDIGLQGYVSGPIAGDVLAGSIAFSNRRSNGYARNVAYGAISPGLDRAFGTNRMSKQQDELYRGKLLFRPTDYFDILATGYYTRMEGDRNEIGYAMFGGSATVANTPAPGGGAFTPRVTGSRPWEYAFDAPRPNQLLVGYGASVKMDWTLEPGTITSISAYSRTKNNEWVDSDQSYAPTCLASFICNGPRDYVLDRNFSQELIFTSEKIGRFNFVAGGNYYRSTGVVDVGVSEFDMGAFPGAGQIQNPPLFVYTQKVKTKAIGIFAEGNYDVTDALTLTAGLRYSHEKKYGTVTLQNSPLIDLIGISKSSFTPRVSLRYAVDDRSNVYATWSKGFKSGVIPSAAPGAQPTKPEKITAYEVGYKTSRRGFSFNIAAFYYDYSDLQVSSSQGAGGTITVINNAASARIYGLDVDGTIQVTPELSLRGGVSWLPHADFKDYPNAVGSLPFPIAGFSPVQVIDLSGTRLYKTPKITATAGLTYETDVAGGKFSFSPNVYYASTLFVEATHLPRTDNFKLGFETAYEPAGSNFRFALWGKNLTNDDAFVSVQATGSALALIPGAPREFGATVSYKF